MIPKQVTILGHTIKVSRVKVIPKHKDCRGLWVPNKNKIYVKIEPGNTDLEYQTYCHELMHAILDNMGENDMSNNEKFVDMLGSLVHQALKTAIY